MAEDIQDDHGPKERLPLEYEPPSLIDLDDLEGVTGGQSLVCMTGGSVEFWPQSDWKDV